MGCAAERRSFGEGLINAGGSFGQFLFAPSLVNLPIREAKVPRAGPCPLKPSDCHSPGEVRRHENCDGKGSLKLIESNPAAG